jgi:hypothetical protein
MGASNAPDQKRARIFNQNTSIAPVFWIWLLAAPMQRSIAKAYRKVVLSMRWMPDIAVLNRPGHARLSSTWFCLQRLDQQQHFGGLVITEARILGKAAVAAAGGDRLEGCEEGEMLRPAGIGGELLEGGGDFGWIAAGQGLENGQRQAA